MAWDKGGHGGKKGMKTYRTVDLGTIDTHKISIVEAREVHSSDCAGRLWANAMLTCAAIVITSGTKTYAFDITGRALPLNEIPD
jgi:hypothetical protein